MTNKKTISPETPDLKTPQDYVFGPHEQHITANTEGLDTTLDIESPLYMGNKAGIDKDLSAFYHGKIFPAGNEIDEEKDRELQEMYSDGELSPDLLV